MGLSFLADYLGKIGNLGGNVHLIFQLGGVASRISVGEKDVIHKRSLPLKVKEDMALRVALGIKIFFGLSWDMFFLVVFEAFVSLIFTMTLWQMIKFGVHVLKKKWFNHHLAIVPHPPLSLNRRIGPS